MVCDIGERLVMQQEDFDGDVPIVRYELSFPKQKLLLGFNEGSSAKDKSSDTSASQAYSGITEQLSESIKWESHVDAADKIDYIVAVSSGVITGLIDSFFTGEFSFDHANEWGTDKVNRIVMKTARAEGYEGDSLKGAIKKLEDNHKLAADGNTSSFGGGKQHHFRDFTHHFGIGGLAMSIFTQFTGLSVGTDTAGNLIVVPIHESDRQYLGKNFHEKIVFGTIGWFFHMVSDMAGSSGAIGSGTGIPGPLLSFMKELSTLPFFKNSENGGTGFRLWLSRLFNGTLLADHDADGRIVKGTERRFNLRMEIGMFGELGRQTMPVLVNQCIVRGFYLCRRLSMEIADLDVRDIGDLNHIAPEDILPWNTPAMHRMITVSSGVFTAVDVADAAVRAMRSKDPVQFLLRINYIGIATFVVACVVDARTTLANGRLKDGERPEDAYEHELSDLGCLKLDFQKARILHSLMRQIVLYDIDCEKHDKRTAKKRMWLDEWSGKIAETVGLIWTADTGYFMDDESLYTEIKMLRKDGDDAWLWLVAMELIRFKPYIFLHGDNDKNYKGLKLCSNYINKVFCSQQEAISAKSLQKLNKTVNNTSDMLNGATTKRVAGLAGTAIIAVVTAGTAFYLAPSIAPVLAAALGAETASLSGAALTSASLAFLGGGAIAAGGAGMAGGTMLIAGGGALLGAAGGSGLSAASSMALAMNGSYVLEECAKLVGFCKEVLINRYDDFASVNGINTTLSMRIVELEARIESIKRNISDDAAFEEEEKIEDDELTPKKMLKVLNRSLKYMKRGNAELSKALKAAGERNKQARLGA